MDDARLTVVLVWLAGFAAGVIEAELALLVWLWRRGTMDEMGVHDLPARARLKEWLSHLYSARVQRPIELTTAMVLAAWGVLLLLPFNTFGGSAYAALRALPLNEAHWGAVFLGVALLMVGGLAANRTRLRMVGLILAAGLFGFIATMFLLSNLAGFGWAGNYGYAALCLVALRRLEW